MFLNLIYLCGVDVVLGNMASRTEIFSASQENHPPAMTTIFLGVRKNFKLHPEHFKLS